MLTVQAIVAIANIPNSYSRKGFNAALLNVAGILPDSYLAPMVKAEVLRIRALRSTRKARSFVPAATSIRQRRAAARLARTGAFCLSQVRNPYDEPRMALTVAPGTADYLIRNLRAFVGQWPYQAYPMDLRGGSSVMEHEGEPIAAALIAKGWVRTSFAAEV